MSSIEEYRIEHDLMGAMRVPKNAYYGVQTMRAVENFPISGRRVDSEMIVAIAQIKKAAAMLNANDGQIPLPVGKAICQACDEIIKGQLHDQFLVDSIQGGAGTSMNMNANEVIANRAIEIMGGEKGDYTVVHPNDHVNCGQSTNDVYPSCGKMALIKKIDRLLEALMRMTETLNKKAQEFDSVVKMGRTQLQDAVPIRLGQEFQAYSVAIRRDIRRISQASHEVRELNLGGTAIGTGVNASPAYIESIVPLVAELTDEMLVKSRNLVDGTQNLDVYSTLSGALKTCAVNLSKISNDLRLMSSGPRTGLGEINLPTRQNGSSIMPGKVNPVIPEVMNQIAFNVIGNDTTITMATEGGQLELNAFEPIIFYKLFESLHTLTEGVNTLRVNCIRGITANKERCRYLVEHSVGIVTTLCPIIGYTEACHLAKEAIETGANVRDLVLEKGLVPENQLDELMDPYKMTVQPK
ncbi:MAG: aspartate ammonia-lyase [Clostridia bacterium]|nr:aspartate ammonia-lyase [Clostridia bacterium]